MLKSSLSLVVVLIVSFLTGCASTAAKRTDQGVELDFKAEQNQGFVMLKVISTQPISLLNPKWQSITASKKGQSVDLRDITPAANMFTTPIPTESLYFAKLDAGTYDITGMGSVGPGPGLLLALMTSDNTSFEKQSLPKFDVVAGKLANLGTVIYAPAIETIRPERMFLLDGEVGKQSAKETLLAEAVNKNSPLEQGGGWEKSSESETAVLNEAIKSISMLSILSTGGEVVAGSHLGQVLKRSGPQKWTSESIGTLDRILSVAQTTDGKLIAGSLYGKYFVNSRAQSWVQFNLPDVKGHIRAIYSHANGTFFIVQEAKAVRVLHKKELLNAVEIPTEIWKSQELFSSSLLTDDAIVIAQNEAGISRETVLTRIDMKTLAVTSKKENFWVYLWQYLPNKEIKLSRQNGLSLYMATSTDNGRTWAKIDAPSNAGAYWLDSTTAYSFDTSMGFSTVGNKLQKTTDTGKTWATLGNEFRTKNFAGVIAYADEKEILVQGANMLYSSTNQGKSWERIFPIK